MLVVMTVGLLAGCGAGQSAKPEGVSKGDVVVDNPRGNGLKNKRGGDN